MASLKLDLRERILLLSQETISTITSHEDNRTETLHPLDIEALFTMHGQLMSLGELCQLYLGQHPDDFEIQEVRYTVGRATLESTNEIGKFAETIIEPRKAPCITKAEDVAPSNFDALLALNPELQKWIEGVHRKDFPFPYLAMAIAQFISTDDLDDKGAFVRENLFAFYNPAAGVYKAARKQKYRHVSPINRDDLTGGLLRSLEHALKTAGGEKRAVRLPVDAKHFRAGYSPDIDIRAARDEDVLGTPIDILRCTTVIPLSKIKKGTDIRNIVDIVKSALYKYVRSGSLILYPTLSACPEYVQRFGVDVSSIADKGIDFTELIAIHGTAKISGESITLRYRISPYLDHFMETMLSNKSMQAEADAQPLRIIGKWHIAHLSQEGLRSSSEDPKLQEYQQQRRAEFEANNGSLIGIWEYIRDQCRDELERRMKGVYERKLTTHEQAAAEKPTPENVFRLGIFQALAAYEKGANLVNQAIRMGILEQEVPVLFGMAVKKNHNPLEGHNHNVKCSL